LQAEAWDCSDNFIDRYLQPSDEEVLGYEDSDAEDPVDDDIDSAGDDRVDSEEEEDGVQDWGTSKADYYDADIIETEADALEEEAEARRLQQKQLQTMTEADFGFDEAEWAQGEDEQDAEHGTVVEKLPDVVVTEDTPVVERLKILKSRYPELEPLSKEYTKLQAVYEELQLSANAASVESKQHSKKRKACTDEPVAPVSIAVLKWRALSTYLGSIAMYFAMLTSPASGKSEANAPMAPAELRQHPVMQSLLKSRQSWDAVKDLQLPETEDSESGEESDGSPEELPIKPQPTKITQAVSQPTIKVTKPEQKPKKSKKSKDTASHSIKPNTWPPKDPSTTNLLNTLDNLIANVKNPSSSSARARPHTHTSSTSPAPSEPSSSSSIGDSTPLTASERLEKSTRKRNLRFYTSQLAQKSNKRASTSQNAGGDADIPYKERLKDRQERLLREAERRGLDKSKGKAGREMDFQDDDDDDEGEDNNDREDKARTNPTTTTTQNHDNNDDEEEDYYQLITSKTSAKKAAKIAQQAQQSAPFASFIEDPSTTNANTKRAITYEISANKGLMPRRKKEVRNPRVKKRMKYDEKMKKLGSVRQVWKKGGEGRGGYGGELTGIKTNVVRSVKL
jgi:U3 small nucleolar RNA-associated protein 3